MKVVGKRRPQTGLEAAARMLSLVVELRERLPGRRPFVRKGVYRFKTFEEAQAAAFKAQLGEAQLSDAQSGQRKVLKRS